MTPTYHPQNPQQPGCEPWCDELKAYLDGELNPGARTGIEAHLETCPACREELDLMRLIEAELRADEDAAPATLNEDLKSRILQAAAGLPQQEARNPFSAPTKSATRGPWWNQFALYGGTIGVAALLIVAGLTISGSRIKNTFNTAASSINTSTGDERYSADGADGSPAPMAAPAVPGESAPAGPVRSAPSFGMADGANKLSLDNQPWVPADRQIHKSAQLGVGVPDADAASDSVEKLVHDAGGYVESNSLQTGTDGLRSATMELKIPVDHFEASIRQISALGNVTQKNIQTEDITERSAAAQARAGVLNQELAIGEARLSAATKKAKHAGDTAVVRDEVRQLRVQNAEARARAEVLRKSASLSDLSLILSEKTKPVQPVGFWEESGNSLHEAWTSFQSTAQLPLKALIWILAYSPFWIPVFLIWRKYGRRPAE
jgi:anti-sigma factor RsiW